ncbi:MAG: SpoIIE family protein phosphatase [Actinomycetota bacterium]|nr:SpoIIE family protein phosphatase [Actinomycetota bacterium]
MVEPSMPIGGQGVETPSAGAIPARMLEQALVATTVAFTVSDPRQDDNPLVWVNPAFTQMTGYGLEEAVGRNCRFLQGPATSQEEIARLRAHIETGEACTAVLLNYRKDGGTFWNEVTVNAVSDEDDQLVNFVGIQTDVTGRVRANVDRVRAEAAEERARQRLSLLAEATGALVSTLDVRDALQRLAELVVPSLGDWVCFTAAEHDQFTDVVAYHRHGHEALLHRFAELLPGGLSRHSVIRTVLENRKPVRMGRIDAESLARHVDDPELLEIINELGTTSGLYVPLLSRRNQALGALVFLSGDSERTWDRSDLEVAADLGRRAGLSIDNAWHYRQEHQTAETLQRSLLPEVPAVDGLTISARYLPADSAADVGGDFYEVTALVDGTYSIAVGDVVGHDMAAAAAMGHLRILLRCMAWESVRSEGRADPAKVLDRTDEMVQALSITAMATVLFGRLTKPAEVGGVWRLALCNAGHPPALLRMPDGRVDFVGVEPDVLLGAVTGVVRTTTEVVLERGTMLIAYTDGLIEVPGTSIDDGLATLQRRVEALGPDAGPEAVVDALTASTGESLRDDIALLAICIG